jgi:UDP-glucuronate 4-epimerase
MQKKKVLITGVAGFIGFALAEKLIKKNFIVHGIDNFDNYYSVKLKKKRIELLKRNNNFHFRKINFTKKNNIKLFFKGKKFETVIHLGAQAGVRYSLTNPDKYIDTNFIGFINIIENSIKNKIKKFIFASSSSVYGEQKNFPIKENIYLDPKNIYARTKKLNEEIAFDIHRLNKIDITGLRLFTVYGEWGRPDMFIMKFLKCLYNKEKLKLFNKGNHYRDFTYIDDVVEIISKLIIKKQDKKFKIFNICSNKPIHLKKLINIMVKQTKKIPNILLTNFQKADVLKTHGDNQKIKRYLKYYKFTKIEEGIKKTIIWYKDNKIWKY